MYSPKWLFFFPGILALCIAGTLEADRAWMTGERSNSPATVPLAPFKTIIPIVGVLMLLPFLGACEREGPLERAGEEVDEAVDDIRNGGETPGNRVDDAADDVRDGVNDARRELDR